MNGKIIRTLLVSESIWSFGSGLFFPIFAIFSAQVGGDIIDAGIAAAIFLFVTSVLEYPIGKLLSKYNEKYFIVADYFLEALVFVGYIFVNNPIQLFVLQAILGLANAIGDPAWESLYGRSAANVNSGKLWADSHMYVGIFNSFGILLGAFLVNIYGFSAVFAIGALFSLIAGIISIKYIKSK